MKLGSIPSNAQLRGLSLRVFQVLSKYTAFLWAVLQAQCRRSGIDPMALNPGGLGDIIEDLAGGVARFSSVAKGDQVRLELAALRQDETHAATPPIAEPADSVTCPRCFAGVKLGRFCSSCGGPLEPVTRCPRCGAPAGGRYCSSCGAALLD